MKQFSLVLYLLAGLFAIAFALNLVLGPQWIETLFEAEPDGGDGSLEAVLVVAPAVAALALGGAGFLVRHRVRTA